MFDINVSADQMKYASSLVQQYNFGMRGYGDGNKREQLTGMIGQTVFADLVHLPRPSGETGFDHGVDFIVNGKRIDIKTMTRTVPVKPHYVHNFIGYQEKYEVDAYVFASYNIKTQVLTICGSVDKISFTKKVAFYKKGELRYRDDGTSFPAKAPLYEIKQQDLVQANSMTELLSHL